MRLEISSKDIFKPLNKKTILQKVSEEDIFRHYCRIEPQVGILFCSQLRSDKNPTCSFYRGYRELKYKDFATGESLNCFDYVCKVYGCSFKDSLRYIDRDLNLGLGNVKIKGHVALKKPRVKVEGGEKSDIRVTTRNFDKNDADYWTSYGLVGNTLKAFNVKAVDRVFYSGNAIAKSTFKDPIYAYFFPKSKNIKVYRPFNQKMKWLGTVDNNDVYGESLYEPGSELIITSSGKDAMVLHQLGYSTIAPQAESNIFSKPIVNMMSWADQPYLLFDNDGPGKACSKLRVQDHPELISLFMPENSGAKDPSDYAQLYGIEALDKLLKQLIYEKQRTETPSSTYRIETTGN